ncbi:MAG: hypothetical protein ABIH70_01685 [Chloroflexota bacterium]
MVTSEVLQSEEEFRRYHDRLRRELNEADWHFSVVRYISSTSNKYLKELNQSPGFWGLTMNSHISSTLMHLNNLFGKGTKEKHLHMRSFLDFVKENPDIFSREAFERRLRTVGRYDELAIKFDPWIAIEKVEKDIGNLNNLPISGLRVWRNRMLSHINKDSVREDIDIVKKYPVRTKHILEIIDTLHNMLNEYCLAFDFSTHSKDLTIENGIEYILEAVRFRLGMRKKSI